MDWKEIYKELPKMTYEENSELIRAACARNITLSCPAGQQALSSGQDVGLGLIEKFFSTAKFLDGTPLMSEEAAGAIQDLLATMDEGGQEPPAESLFRLPGDKFLRQVHEAGQRSFDDAMESYAECLSKRNWWNESHGIKP